MVVLRRKVSTTVKTTEKECESNLDGKESARSRQGVGKK